MGWSWAKAQRSLKPKEIKWVGAGADLEGTWAQASPRHRLFVWRVPLSQPHCDSVPCVRAWTSTWKLSLSNHGRVIKWLLKIKLFMSFSIHIRVTIIKIHKYLDTLLTDGVFCNSHTEYVSFQNGLFQSWHVSELSVTKISTWYLILQKCIFTNTQLSFDRKTGLVTIHICCPNNTVLPPASLLCPWVSWKGSSDLSC